VSFWVLIIAIIINVSLSLVIFTRATKASSTAYFGISAFFAGLWAVGALLLLFGKTSQLAHIGLLLFLIAPMITTLYMVLFSKYFSDIVSKNKLFPVVGFSLLLVCASLFTLLAVPDQLVIVSLNNNETNILNFQHSWFIFYGLYFMIMFLMAYVYLLLGVVRSRGKLRRQRRLVLVGIYATSFLALVTNIILPLIGYSDLIWLGPAWTLFYISTTCYAMVRHGLFDLRSALVLTFTYILSLLVLASLYYFIALAVSTLFLTSGIAGRSFDGIDIAIALFLAFLFQPVRKFFDKFTSRIFYQDSYSVDDFFAAISRTLTSTNNMKSLLEKVSSEISQRLKALDTSFIVYTNDEKYEQFGVGKYARIGYKDATWLNEYFKNNGPQLKVITMLDEADEALRRVMISHRIAVVLPLYRQEEIKGYLFLGEHKRSYYSARDIRVIKALADELVIAIQNAISVEEIRTLNGHLEQRIDNATKELRASNAQLQRLDEAKDEFISMASHQLRTPLTSIKGYISMLMEGDLGKVTKDQQHVLQEAFLSSERMVRLIGDFLNVSRLQTGKFTVEKRPIDLAQLVQNEIDALETSASSRNLSFAYKKPTNIPLVSVDENKMQQVVMNFCDNALYYSRPGSVISVTLKKVGAQIECKVKDTGIGVPEQERAHLFTKFFRATNARKQRPDGTGVGLFLAKKVIDAHGGEIIFESKEKKGSTFGFRLPLSK
jgi:signal transduction histidine kinase